MGEHSAQPGRTQRRRLPPDLCTTTGKQGQPAYPRLSLPPSAGAAGPPPAMHAALAILRNETAWAPCSQSANKLQESQSVCQQGPLRKQACFVKDRREASGGEDLTEFFRKTSKITSLWTSPRRKPSVLRAEAHRNGLRDVKEARTSPLLPPESRRLGSLISDFLRKNLVYFAEKFDMYPTYSARNTDFFILRKK